MFSVLDFHRENYTVYMCTIAKSNYYFFSSKNLEAFILTFKNLL